MGLAKKPCVPVMNCLEQLDVAAQVPRTRGNAPLIVSKLAGAQSYSIEEVQKSTPMIGMSQQDLQHCINAK